MILEIPGGVRVELLSSLRRRWILVCIFLFITLVGTALAYVKLPWTYQASSSIVFLASKNMAKSFNGNQYLAFNAALNQTADVVRYETNDLRTVNSLASRGYSSTYLVMDAIDTPGPVLIVTVTGHQPASVENTLHGVTNEVSAKLAILQSGLAPNFKIQDLVITFSPQPIRIKSKKARPLSVIAGLGLVLTIAVPTIVDAALLRRKDRKASLPQENAVLERKLTSSDRDRASRYRNARTNVGKPSEKPVAPREPDYRRQTTSSRNYERHPASPHSSGDRR
jgi:capsular polysaccharide biosynthesis protein